MIVGLHALMFLSARTPNSLLTPLDAVEVALEPMGDSPEDQAAVAEIAPSEPPPARAAATAPPEPAQAELTAPPPQVIAPDAIPLAVAAPPEVKPKPVVKPTPMTRPRPKPTIEEAEEDKDDDRPTPAELRAQRNRGAGGLRTSSGSGGTARGAARRRAWRAGGWGNVARVVCGAAGGRNQTAHFLSRGGPRVRRERIGRRRLHRRTIRPGGRPVDHEFIRQRGARRRGAIHPPGNSHAAPTGRILFPPARASDST